MFKDWNTVIAVLVVGIANYASGLREEEGGQSTWQMNVYLEF